MIRRRHSLIRLIFFVTFLVCNEIFINAVPKVDVHFSPNGNCQEAILDKIKQAKRNIYVQSYTFTSFPIANELIKAKERGIKVTIITDLGQIKAMKSQIESLIENGLDVRYLKIKGLHHSKTIVIDDCIVITGSYNFTKAAEYRNVENLVIIEDKAVTRKYKINLEKLFGKSIPFLKHVTL